MNSETREKLKKKHSLRINSLEGFGSSIASGRAGNLSVGIHFNGKKFIEPLSNLELGVLFCSKFSHNFSDNAPIKKHYRIVWNTDAQTEMTDTMRLGTGSGWYGNCEHYDDLCTSTREVLEEAIDDDEAVERVDEVQLNEENYKSVLAGALNAGGQDRLKTVAECVEKSKKAIKYCCSELSEATYELECLAKWSGFIGCSYPQLKLHPKFIAKVMSRILSPKDHEEGDAGYYGERAREVLRMCSVLSDPDAVNERREVII